MYQTLIAKHSLLSDQMNKDRLGEVLKALESVLGRNIPGDVAEFGCYAGTTSVFLARLLKTAGESLTRKLYLYDSFEGLPEKSDPDESNAGTQFTAGELKTTRTRLRDNFQKAGLTKPIITKAWFGDLETGQLPESIAFAFLDGDFYQSIFDSLRLVWPRLSHGGSIAVDDYEREALPGVSRAVQAFFADKPVKLSYAHHVAVITKL